MFEVGQKVWDASVGEGVVTRIRKESHYPVVALFNDGNDRVYTIDGKSLRTNVRPSLYPYPVEIVRKTTKPSINWSHVRSEYQYLAQDANGTAWLYWEEPEMGNNHWYTAQGICTKAESHASYDPGLCAWKDSLVKRPEVE